MIRFEEVQAQVQARILDEVQARISAVNKPLALIALPATRPCWGGSFLSR